MLLFVLVFIRVFVLICFLFLAGLGSLLFQLEVSALGGSSHSSPHRLFLSS